jgi:hypothetical protein
LVHELRHRQRDILVNRNRPQREIAATLALRRPKVGFGFGRIEQAIDQRKQIGSLDETTTYRRSRG